MTEQTETERSLRAYLLGKLARDEEVRIEEQLLVASDQVELLMIVEEELLDDYLGGTLSGRDREQFEQHFLSTPERQRKLRMARALKRYVNNQPLPAPARVSVLRPKASWSQVFLRPAWRSAIAAMLVLGVGLAILFYSKSESLVNKGRAELQAALKESPTEARIAGFNWNPQSVTLGAQPESGPDSDKMNRAFSYFRDAKGPDSAYALGQFYLAKGDLDNAIKQFTLALEGMPKNARLHSDLGAAWLEKARVEKDKVEKDKNDQSKDSDNTTYYLSQSCEHLNRALELDDSLLEALFNRALCLQRMQSLKEAANDWRAYLNRDANSAWAREARRHLEEIEQHERTSSQSNKEQFEQFLVAYKTGDRQTAWKALSQTRELISGRLIWWELLDNFFELQAAGQPAEADARMEALSYVGELELHLGEEEAQAKGDPYISRLAEFYRKTTPQQRASLSEAHKLMNEGNQFFRDSRGDEALRNYTHAQKTFARVGDDEEAMLANLLAGHCLLEKGETEQSGAVFEQIVKQCREKGYRWLLAESCFRLAMVQDQLAEHSKALENTIQALQVSEEISDNYNTQRSLAQIADQYRKLGNYELATAYLNRCLKEISVAWPGNRQMWRSCDQLTQVLAARRLNAAADAYASESLRLALEEEDSWFTYVSYIHLAILRSKQQDYAEAIRLAQLGFDHAPNDVGRAYASLQLGYLRRQAGDLRQALSDYDQSIRYIDSAEAVARDNADPDAARPKTDRLPALRYDAHKGRLFCLFAQGDEARAQKELEITLSLLRKHRESIREEQNRNTFFNVEQSVYDAAINFENSKKKNNPAVFDYSEESRARSLLDLITTAQTGAAGSDEQDGAQPISQPLKLTEVQERLPEQTQLIEYAALDDKLLICLVSKSEFSVTEARIGLSELTDKVMNFRRLILLHDTEPSAQARELYDLLIKQIELSPAKGERICIVPDKVLNNLPFGALISPASGKYLIEDYQLMIAPSATIYLVCSGRTKQATDRSRESLLAVGDPAFDRAEFPLYPPLPSTGKQVEAIAAFYPSPPPSVLTRSGAREEDVKRDMEKSDVIHLASHYVVYEGNPMNSRLLLAKEPGDRGVPGSSAGFLQADEVAGLKLRQAPLVILSACESGVEHYYNGEGMIGMSRVFIAAGAPVVVATLWQVDAFATDKLMIDFHRDRKLAGLSTPEALRQAQMEMISNDSWKHPYYWAGFTTIGGYTGF